LIYDIEAGGATRRVEVVASQSGWTVSVDGVSIHASLSAAGDCWSLLLGEAGAAARSHEVVFSRSGAGHLVVYVDGQPVPVAVVDPRSAAKRSRAGSGRGGSEYDGPGHVSTPMPGRIVKLLVRPGDVVTARQGVIVVEAMKMENELRAPRGGTVSAVHVEEGATVEAGATLITIE
jgi:biotin carboxyl carrier protein